ncbi:MAG: hypothetical protein LBG80_16615 [Bacteroidales bacterium]|nr:hypothetical protein [Bacteroidales bacterium]
MKIIRYILKVLSHYREFLSVWGMVVVYSCESPKSICWKKDFSFLKSLAILKLHVRYGICRLFRYASDFIWLLGKNDLEMFVPVGCFRYRQARICCNYVLQPTEAVQFWK